ncbi:hypothetical protein [Halogranum rubrum]|uniref:Peptidase S54 rhomboid domain-containing protein n=1 Tax=Halogranum salarium B-1 TaxID=1210908 RepID=J2ZLE6_9EURY|nr:hypothetical protein [Halogranum salarium]EJN61570.1 hypothetical protein HSB1_06110 [Halogranum salarium B-1]
MHRRRQLTLDLALILSIPLLLVALHYGVAPATRNQFVFDHDQIALVDMYAANFLHLDDAHLRGNLLGYVAAIAPTWALYAVDDEHRRFRRTLAGFVLGLPLLISLGDYLVFRYAFEATANSATRGFSGIVSALFGWLFVATVALVWRDVDAQRAIYTALTIVLGILGGIVLLSGIATPAILGALGVGVVLSATGFVPWETVRSGGLLDAAREHWTLIQLVAYAGLALLLIVPGLFPVDWIGEGSVTNIFGHAVGFGLGVVISVSCHALSPALRQN